MSSKIESPASRLIFIDRRLSVAIVFLQYRYAVVLIDSTLKSGIRATDGNV